MNRLFGLGTLAGLALLAGCAGPPGAAGFLITAWDSYRQTYIHPSGYVLDPERDGGSVTSEGQGYALLTAVWSGDSATFARVFAWTEANLRREDGLYSWLWSPAAGGGGGIVDTNTAADADQEIAFALILAAQRFGESQYLDRARDLLSAIREVEMLALPNGPFPAAGNWAMDQRIINLSYFLPYAYPFFAAVDPGGDWEAVITQGYDLIEQALAPHDARLIPDFARVDSAGRVTALPEGSPLSADFSFDAMRIFWRVAADCLLTKRPAACADPLGVRTLDTVLLRDGSIHVRYATDGHVLDTLQSLSFYASLLPAFRLHAPDLASSIRRHVLGQEPLRRLERARDRYYDRNWVWFGLALDNGLIADRLAALSPADSAPAPPLRP